MEEDTEEFRKSERVLIKIEKMKEKRGESTDWQSEL